jgi:hypothetical protein
MGTGMSKASRLGEGERRRAAGKKREGARRKNERDDSGNSKHPDDERGRCRNRRCISHALAIGNLHEHAMMAGLVRLTMMNVFVKKGGGGHRIEAKERQKQQSRNAPLQERQPCSIGGD